MELVGGTTLSFRVYPAVCPRTSWTSEYFGYDVDNLRYDAAKKLVHVAYGDDDAGAIAILESRRTSGLEHDIQARTHPDLIQLEATV